MIRSWVLDFKHLWCVEYFGFFFLACEVCVEYLYFSMVSTMSYVSTVPNKTTAHYKLELDFWTLHPSPRPSALTDELCIHLSLHSVMERAWNLHSGFNRFKCERYCRNDVGMSPCPCLQVKDSYERCKRCLRDRAAPGTGFQSSSC